MRKERAIFFIGLWVGILPFLGFPEAWRKLFFIITGVTLVSLSYQLYLRARALKRAHEKEENRSKTFVDNIGAGE
jgi:uncharacterized membrane protein YczE